MIVGLNGKVEHKEPTLVHIDVNGVIYEVFISLHTYADITSESVKLLTHMIVREDAQLLFGFSKKSEKVLFLGLLKISGVGPKVAMAICSTYTPEQFASVISSKDVNALKKVPGIGAKGAARIMVELAGFDEVLIGSSSEINSSMSEAIMALESLGFKKEHILKALSGCESSDTATLVKDGLKKLQKL